MHLDVIDMHGFYSGALGEAARQVIGASIRRIWPNLKGLSLLGVGYAVPYLPSLQGDTARTIAFMPATQGVMHWPRGGASLTGLVDETQLPLADGSIERILLVHSLETSEHIRSALRELWRVLAPAGKLLIVAPNRMGMWAQREATPFGYGRPFSRVQLTHLLRDCLFSPEQWSTALYVPPFTHAATLSSPEGWERIGKIFWPRFSGVLLVEASKQIYIPVNDPARARIRKMITAQLQPATANPRVS